MLVPFKGPRSNSQAPSKKSSTNQLTRYNGGRDNGRTRNDDFALMPFQDHDDFFGGGRGGFGNMFKEFNQLSKRMLGGFDSDLFGGSLFNNMNKQMERMFQGFDDGNMFDVNRGGEGVVIKRTYVGSTKIDENGRRQEEKYFSNNVTQKKDGNLITDKKQGYKNSTNGVEKLSHERRLNDQGRKFTKERIRDAGEEMTHHYYHNIDESEAHDFDRRWNEASSRFGFMDKNKRALFEDMSERNQPRVQDFTGRKKKADRNPESLLELEDRDYKNDQRRGDYIPYQKKLNNKPVRVTNGYGNFEDPYFPRQRASDLMPTFGGGGIAQGAAIPVGAGAVNLENPSPNRNAMPMRNSRIEGNQGAGIYRNRGSTKNDIPKAG